MTLSNGMVLLEENGADRLVVGDAIQPLILGSVGKRKRYRTLLRLLDQRFERQ